MIRAFIKWLRGCDHVWGEWQQTGYDDISRFCSKCDHHESEFTTMAEAYPPRPVS